jgi:hypothetical protein
MKITKTFRKIVIYLLEIAKIFTVIAKKNDYSIRHKKTPLKRSAIYTKV